MGNGLEGEREFSELMNTNVYVIKVTVIRKGKLAIQVFFFRERAESTRNHNVYNMLQMLTFCEKQNKCRLVNLHPCNSLRFNVTQVMTLSLSIPRNVFLLS